MVRDFLILPEGGHAQRVFSQVVLTVTGGLLTESLRAGHQEWPMLYFHPGSQRRVSSHKDDS